jgi:hypothetical protein
LNERGAGFELTRLEMSTEVNWRNIAVSLKTLSAGVAREREVGEAIIIKPEGSDAKSESRGLEDLFERPGLVFGILPALRVLREKDRS